MWSTLQGKNLLLEDLEVSYGLYMQLKLCLLILPTYITYAGKICRVDDNPGLKELTLSEKGGRKKEK